MRRARPLVVLLVLFAALAATQQSAFDPRGDYRPTRSLAINGYTLRFMQLYRTRVELQFGRTGDESNDVYVTCRHAVVTPDTLRANCEGRPVGQLSIDGAFLDKRGRFWRWADVAGKVVLQATFTFERPRRAELAQFTYVAGD